MFTEILNPFLNVRNKVKDSQGKWVDQTKPKEVLQMKYDSGITTSGTTEIPIFEIWNKKVIIDQLEYGSNTSFHPRLWQKPEHVGEPFENQLFTVPTREGGGSSAWPSVISTQETSLLKSGFWESPRGMVFLKRPIILPSGGKLIFEGSSSSDGKSAFKVVWREIEE